ncbi:MAG TPA: cupin domain-containing protein [Streptosporangiaceae bacterium]|jgi:quercetin dioxygenase-like cupin family protein
MPVVHPADTVVHELHGARFTSYAAPARGSSELCAWRLDLAGGATGVPHTVSREEILFVLSGSLQVTFEPGTQPEATTPEAPTPGPAASPAADQTQASRPGDAILVPAGSTIRVDNPSTEPAAAWVTTSVGLEASLPDGSVISPLWVR